MNGHVLIFCCCCYSGIQTSQDARFYGLSAKFDKFSNEGKTLVVQFTVKHEQDIDCGGGYVKIFPSDLDQSDMHGESPYNIMFGKFAFLLFGSALSHFPISDIAFLSEI